MRKRTVLVVLVLVLLWSVFIASLFLEGPAQVEPKIIYVDTSNVGDPAEDGSLEHPFDRIREGVDEASPGYTVHVAPGTYYENVVINKSSISLVGEENTIIDGDGAGTIIYVTGQNVNVSGLTAQNGYQGISLAGSNITLSGNNVLNNSFVGITVSGERNTLRENHMTDNMYNFRIAGEISRYSTHRVEASNTVDGKPIYYWVNQHNRQVPTDAGYAAVINSINITVTRLNLSSNWQGILFVNTTDSTIKDVNVSKCRVSIAFEHCGFNTARNNTLSQNFLSISIDESNDNSLRHNNMRDNQYNFAVKGSRLSDFIQDVDVSNTIDGKPVYYLTNQKNLVIDSYQFQAIGYLGMVNSTNVRVKDLTITNNGQGVLFAQTTNSTIINVKALDNLEGISLWNSSGNTIIRNTISKNNEAIRLVGSKGNKFSENTLSQNSLSIKIENSSDNTFYRNNFLNNTGQVDTTGSISTWDDGLEGNYWSDYNGTDNDGDGVGDIPYMINENNQDNYPLMNPWKVVLGDLNEDGVVNELDLLIWADAMGSYPGHERWNPVADVDGDGLVDLYDAILILKNIRKGD